MLIAYELVPTPGADRAVAELPPGSRVSVTCSPVRGVDATVDLAVDLAGRGHHVVPHLAARAVSGDGHLAGICARLAGAGISEVFVIGGDGPGPAGPWADAGSLLEALLAAVERPRRIGVAAYPDGHPDIGPEVLRAALRAKQAMLADAGVDGWASTQMCLSPPTIVRWLESERATGLTLPVHLGVPGAVERTRLVRMAARLGVATSFRYLRKNRSALGALLGRRRFDPAGLVAPVSARASALGVEGLHLFTFNQVAATVAWVRRTYAA